MKYSEKILSEQIPKNLAPSVAVQLVERITRTHKSSYMVYRYYLIGRGRRAVISRSAAIILGIKI